MKPSIKTKVLFDTDIGSDIDDAVCLAYLLAQSQCDLVGITTVSGESVKRAMLASVLCKQAHRHIPIFPGIEAPLKVPLRQRGAPQAKVLNKWPHQTDFPKDQALEFMRKTIHDNPGEIVLLAVGPMTNLSTLFRIDPEIPSLLKGLYLMCGDFEIEKRREIRAEWNARCDPHASDEVYKARASIHRSVGLNVTTKVLMDTQEVKQEFNIPLLQPVLDMAEVWFEQRKRIVFHDPLAAAIVFDHTLCEFQRGDVTVNLENNVPTGLTVWNADPENGTVEVASSVAPERFFNHYFSVFE